MNNFTKSFLNNFIITEIGRIPADSASYSRMTPFSFLFHESREFDSFSFSFLILVSEGYWRKKCSNVLATCPRDCPPEVWRSLWTPAAFLPLLSLMVSILCWKALHSRRSGLEGVRAGEKELRGPPQALVRPAEGEKRSSHRTIRCSAKKRPMAASRETGQGMMNVCAVGVAIIAFL